MNSYDLAGRTAVITGGAGGLGRAIAARMIASGACVALWDLRGAAAAAAEIGASFGQDTDVGDEASVAAALAATGDVLGPVDILVTAAGMTGPTAPVVDHPVAGWRSLLDVHLTGTFLCTQAVLPGMISRDYGRIVTVASVAGKEGNLNAAGYSAVKAGIIGFTKSLGKELALTGVRANCFVPGLIDTPLMAQLPPQQISLSLSKIPQQRLGTAEEAGAMVTFMASGDCSFNSGAVFDLSGGRATY